MSNKTVNFREFNSDLIEWILLPSKENEKERLAMINYLTDDLGYRLDKSDCCIVNNNPNYDLCIGYGRKEKKGGGLSGAKRIWRILVKDWCPPNRRVGVIFRVDSVEEFKEIILEIPKIRTTEECIEILNTL